MIGLILRLFFVVMVLVGVLFLFAFSFVATLVVTPIILLLIYFFGRRHGVLARTVRTGQSRRDGRAPYGPIIDHDPNDLPNERKDG